ncbi:MAG: hypothetical protein A2096_08655 [Spirochaetes bacterium GWF1_41_5]|nr:MAG: hypothetical protein A2096_08655 [Spirochaetes bacterium GWF1_41_5]
MNISDFISVATGSRKIRLSPEKFFIERINRSYEVINECIKKNIPVYGVTTGFGDSCRNHISYDDAKKLQENLVKYHGCGVGPYFSDIETVGIVLLRLISNSKGSSGVRYDLLRQLELFVNTPIIPLIPELGSVGASGDLTPLSYLAAALSGRRKVIYKNKIMDAKKAIKLCGHMPLSFEPKEALAIMNGTSVMTSVAGFCIHRAILAVDTAEIITAMAVEVLEGNKGSFAPFIHKAKPFKGQIESARNIGSYLSGSKKALAYKEMIDLVKSPSSEKQQHTFLERHIQDRYSLRCAPHVIGVLRDTINFCKEWVETEMNSVTDNPLVDPDSGTIYSGGNFYGGHICAAMDSLRAASASTMDLIDKQMELIVDEKFNNALSPNLISSTGTKPFLRHGFKAMQITCTSLAAECLAHTMPVSSLSRPTEALNQDKVSLGTISARETRTVLTSALYGMSVMLLALCQAMELRGLNGFSDPAREVFNLVRGVSPFVSDDRELDADINSIYRALENGTVQKIALKYR